MRLYRRLLLVATLLAFAVIALGAYVRLSDAGLGCPDWPGCYGHWLGVPDAAHEQLAAQQAYPGKPVDSAKAWKEMVHRYFAGTLGLLILALCLLSWRSELRRRQSPALPTLLLVIVGIQAALGMWTVTLLLKPLIVTLHLLGGMATLSLLVGLALSNSQTPPSLAPGPGARWLAAGALLAVLVQIALGGWVSSNYAALACPDFPLCQGQWRPVMEFGQAFSLHRELGQTAAGELLPFEALTAIHWTHRLGALAVAVLAGALAVVLRRTGERRWRNWGGVLLCLLLAQIALGMANVLLALPLGLAVAHNLGAAVLLTVLLSINIRLRPAGQRLAPASGPQHRGLHEYCKPSP
ncbi:COX15/CtaA family protein [Dechloromonas sp. A34]|uniref:COX15/CtaA family protein n=1 Tax=Dechloromonas sp. A34 TaxID=447588 RepID=UPI002248AD0F|nr:COX15/CtaA family protein [Dechloromonas sp. A34]